MDRDKIARVSNRQKLNKLIHSTLTALPFKTKSLQALWKQHLSYLSSNRIEDTCPKSMDRSHRRIIRQALHTRDGHKVAALLRNGVDMNITLSDIFPDTPLLYAIKHGYLEIVEILLQTPKCRLDDSYKNKHTLMDIAVRLYLATDNRNKHIAASRFRIVKCLLRYDVGNITLSFMDSLFFSSLQTITGKRKVKRLAKLAADSTCLDFKDALLCLLLQYKGMQEQIKLLIQNDASVATYIFSHTYLTALPPQNVSYLIKYNALSSAILQHLSYNVASETKNLSNAFSSLQWQQYQEVFRLIIICGQKLPLSAMTFLYKHDLGCYQWVVAYATQPAPLLDMCRLVIRRSMSNVLGKVESFTEVPNTIRNMLLLE